MSASILHDTTFPHGTHRGYAAGCHGAHCPAPITCRDVRRRYAGDWSFRKQIDAGMTVQEILDAETAQERAEAEAKAARAARRAARPKPRPTAKPKRVVYPRVTVGPTTDQQKAVAELNKKGLTDREIAERIGKTREQVRATRRHLKLPLNAEPTSNITDRLRELHKAGLNDTEIAQKLDKERGYISKVRRGMKLTRNVRYNVDIDEVKKLHARGLTDTQIGEQFDVDRSLIAKLRRRLELTPNKPSTTSGASSLQEAV